MKHTTPTRLLNACAVLTLGASPLWVAAQSPATSPAAGGEPPASAAPPAPPAPALPTPDEAGYMIGVGVGQFLHQYGVSNEIPTEKILEGVKDGLSGKKAEPTDHQRVLALLRSVAEAEAAKNAGAAKAFLERNAKEKGVKTTASGLQYRIIATGNAKSASPQPTDQVTVQYRGTLLDGTEFDSSYKQGRPATFAANRVIKGWQEALVLMKPAAKWQLFVPPELGYGQASRPGIPANSLLIFAIELLSIDTPPRPQAEPAKPAGSPILDSKPP
jgi:FKBP-type peptidyl-prolyl cis-trans isomerase